MHTHQHRFHRYCLHLGCLLFLTLFASPAAHAVARLGPINASGASGATLDIPVGFSSSEQITCLQFDVLFDSAKVTLGAARTGTAAPGHRIESREMATGRQRVVIYSTTLAPLNGGYIVQLPVTWSAAGDSALAVSAVRLADTDGTAVAFTSSSFTPALTSNAPGGGATGGANVALNVEPTTGAGVTYEWTLNGQVIVGATAPTLSLPSAQRFNAGTYQVTVSANGLTLNSQSFTLNVNPPAANNARLLNLSTRGLAQSGANVLIPGFVVQGGTNKKLLIRAVGPTLALPPINFGAAIAPDPAMQLKRLDFSTVPPSYVDVTSNDNWQTNPNAAEITTTSAALGAFELKDPRDSALLVDLPAGQYSVIAGDKDGTSGIAIVELYDADAGTPGTRLINISNRGYCGVGAQVMIPGFVVSSEGPKTLLVRVVGPTLAGAPYNVPGTMADPKLTVFRTNPVNGAQTELFSQDDWSTHPDAAYTEQIANQVFAFALAPGSKDAAFVVTLDPGVYTVVGGSADGTSSGVVLVEVYVVP